MPASKQRFLAGIAALLVMTTSALSADANASVLATHAFSQKSISLNGTAVSNPDGFVQNGTMYMPIWYVMQALNQGGYMNTWNGSVWNITTPASFSGNIVPEEFGTGLQSIVLNSSVKAHVNGVVATDPQSGRPTMYMPIWYVMQLVKQSGYIVQWNGGTWNMAPAGVVVLPASSSLNVASPYIYLLFQSDNSTSEMTNTPNVTQMSPGGFVLNADGSIGGGPGTSVLESSQSNGNPAVLPRIFSNDKAIMTTVLGNAALRSIFAANVASLVTEDKLSGVNLDFEMLPASQRDNYTSLLQELYAVLHPLGKELSVDLPAITNPTTETWNAGYNEAAIGQTVDHVIVMAYDYAYPTGLPGPIAPLWWVRQSLEYTISQIPSGKVILGIDTYSYDWGDGPAMAHGLAYIDEQIAASPIVVKWDAVADAPYFHDTENGVVHTVYYENAKSIADKIKVGQALHVAGIAVWRAGLGNAAVRAVLNEYPGGTQ